MTHNIACCYMTHNHPDVVKRILGVVLQPYDENGIDIYIYDSSTSDETKDFVYSLIEAGIRNLFYVTVDAALSGDGKLLEILQGHGLQKEYDYIWPCKDRSFMTADSVRLIQQESRKNYDCMLIDCWIPVSSDYRNYKKVYGREEFFREFGWMTTSWEVMLFHTDMLLHTIEWDSFIRQYHLCKDQAFNQPLTVFGGLALREDPKIRVLSYKEVTIGNDKAVSSGWVDATFPLWGKMWPDAIGSLPECYEPYKAEVIKSQGMHPNVFGSVDNLIILEKRNAFTREIWDQYKDRWSTLSDIPPRYVEAVLDKDSIRIIQMAIEDFNAALQEKQYKRAYYIFSRTTYLSYLLGSTYYWMIRRCMDVHLREKGAGIENGILTGVGNHQDLLYKYQKLKFYMRRIEYDIPFEKEELTAFLHNNSITRQFINVMIDSECIDTSKLIGYWRQYGYEG